MSNDKFAVTATLYPCDVDCPPQACAVRLGRTSTFIFPAELVGNERLVMQIQRVHTPRVSMNLYNVQGHEHYYKNALSRRNNARPNTVTLLGPDESHVFYVKDTFEDGCRKVEFSLKGAQIGEGRWKAPAFYELELKTDSFHALLELHTASNQRKNQVQRFYFTADAPQPELESETEPAEAPQQEEPQQAEEEPQQEEPQQMVGYIPIGLQVEVNMAAPIQVEEVSTTPIQEEEEYTTLDTALELYPALDTSLDTSLQFVVDEYWGEVYETN